MSSIPKVGEMFDGRYRIDAVLGAGGFGTVFAAHDTNVGRDVALKVLHRDDGDRYDPRTRARFEREVRVVANLQSPNTVQLFEHGEAGDGTLFMVFELLGGEDLAAQLERRGRLEPTEVVELMRQVLQSLSEAHRQGLLHRDLKPENVRLVPKGDETVVKLLDFGLARAANQHSPQITKTGELIGTPRYMAPEQLIEQPLSPAADIYSLGVVAFELLLGRDALPGYQWSDQLERLQKGHIFSMPELDRIGAGLVALLQQMTARSPADRPGSADAVLAMLDVLGPGGRARPIGSVQRERPAQPEASRARTGEHLILGLVLLVVLAGIGGAVFWLAERPSKAEHPAPASKAPHVSNPLGEVAETPRPTDAGVPEIDMRRRPTDAGHAASPGCGSEPPFVGEGTLSVMVGLSSHDSLAYIPKDYDASERHPVVILLRQTAEPVHVLLPHTHFVEYAERDDWIVLLPDDELNSPWTDPSDLDRIADLTAGLQDQLCVDSDRIFVVGHGQGGRAAMQLGCEPWVAAVATNSFRPAAAEEFCPDASKPIMMLSPLHARREPVEGGEPDCPALTGSSGPLASLSDAERRLRTRNGCSDERRVASRHRDGKCFTWTCDNPVYSCHLEGGHGWPGAPPRKWNVAPNLPIAREALDGCDGVAGDFPTGEVIWEFFNALDR